MKFRVARHTADLDAMVHFYHHLLGLEKLGEFKGHQQYDGVFLGFQNENWHLEFTVSDTVPDHLPDEDDILVFYIEDIAEYLRRVEKLKSAGVKDIAPKNPYWSGNGTTFVDPDGYRIVLAVEKD